LPKDLSNPQADVCGPTSLSVLPKLSKGLQKKAFVLVALGFSEFGILK
jgi:hypothetical protein